MENGQVLHSSLYVEQIDKFAVSLKQLAKTFLKLEEKKQTFSEEEIDEMIDMVKKNVPYPDISDLIYWNEEELTPEQIVDKALEYKPMQL